MMLRKFLIVWFSVMIVSLLAGCNLNKDSGAATAEDTPASSVPPASPVQLTLFQDGAAINDDQFQMLIADPVKKKYPNITLDMVRSGKGNTISDLIAAGKIPDLIYTVPNIQKSYLNMNVALDLTDLIKKFNMDLSRFDPQILDAIKQFGPHGEMYSLPFSANTYGLWYNKSIFDKLGVPYPKDGMTWDQTYDLAKKLTRTDGSVQYHGIDPVSNGRIVDLGTPFSLPLIDTKTETAVISDKWAEVFKLAMNGYQLSGYNAENHPLVGQSQNDFVKNQVLAMHPYFTNGILPLLADADKYHFDWDVAQLPSFPEAPNTAYMTDYVNLAISRNSEHKDDALKIIQLLTNDENQLLATKQAKLTSLNNMTIKNQFAAELIFTKGKHMTSILKSKMAKMPLQTIYNDAVTSALIQAFKDVYAGKYDINSALRDAKETADNSIKSLKAQ